MLQSIHRRLHFSQITLIVVAICALLLTTNTVPVTVAQGDTIDWPQFQRDAQNSGHTEAIARPRYRLRWGWFDPAHIVNNFVSEPNRSITDSFGADFRLTVIFSDQVQPIIVNGRLFAGAMNGTFYALDALTGATKWTYNTGGPILATAAYANGVVVVGSMDGTLYGLDTVNGSLRWAYVTGAGISAAPKIHNDTVYAGSRDGYFYALDVNTGALRWRYETRSPENPAMNRAPIVAPSAISADGSIVLFGAENMHFYGLSTADGQERWQPRYLIGQSFQYGWPVVVGNRVIVRTMSSLPGAEESSTGIEEVLANLPSNVSWSQEEAAILDWLNRSPNQKTMYVLDVNTGQEPYQVAMGRVTGNNYTPHPPVLDHQGRLLSYWRTRTPTFIGFAGQDGGGSCFGTRYCPDISALDLSTGKRVTIGPNTGWQPELDNGFALSTGGNYLYGFNSFRGLYAVSLSSGQLTYITAAVARWDCGGWRAAGANIVYYGNDNVPTDCPAPYDPIPQQIYSSAIGYTPPVIAVTNGQPLIYVIETRGGLIAAIEHQP